jgi:hypothetical protein
VETSGASSKAIDANLGKTMGVHEYAVNLMQTMHERKARATKEVAKQRQKVKALSNCKVQ